MHDGHQDWVLNIISRTNHCSNRTAEIPLLPARSMVMNIGDPLVEMPQHEHQAVAHKRYTRYRVAESGLPASTPIPSSIGSVAGAWRAARVEQCGGNLERVESRKGNYRTFDAVGLDSPRDPRIARGVDPPDTPAAPVRSPHSRPLHCGYTATLLRYRLWHRCGCRHRQRTTLRWFHLQAQCPSCMPHRRRENRPGSVTRQKRFRSFPSASKRRVVHWPSDTRKLFW